MNPQLEKELKYFTCNRDKFYKDYPGKYLIIKDCKVMGVFTTRAEAFISGSRKFNRNSFIIQQCTDRAVNQSKLYNPKVTFV